MKRLESVKLKSFSALIATGCCLSVFSQEPMRADRATEDIAHSEKLQFLSMRARTDKGQRSQASTNFDVNYYRCEWEVDPAVNYIKGKLSSNFHITQAASEISYDLSANLTVDSIYYHGAKINFTRPGDAVTIQFPSSISAGTLDSVSIFYQGAPIGGGFGSFIQTDHAGSPVIWTLSEPYGASDWWPCKNGLNDKADSIDVIVTCPDIYRASSNGIELASSFNGGKRICPFKHRYPIATYLVAMAVTNFSVETRNILLGSTNLPILSYIYPEDSAYFASRTPYMLNAMQLYNSTYGDYPFIKEKYGQTQFQWGGGMEHQTNSFVVNGGEELMAHELSHQWFGDKITTGSWQDLWLNEGFATFSQVYYLEKLSPFYYPGSVRQRMQDITSQPGGSVWVDDTTDISRLFDGRLTYNKGGYLLRMLRWKLGDSIFFRALRQYQQDPTVKYGFSRTADFKRNLEQLSGTDLTQFFNDWYYGQGYPTYQLEWTMLSGGWISTRLKETTSHPSVSFFAMPVPIVFRNASQEKTIIIDHKSSGQLDFVNIGFVPDTVLIDPDHWLISANNTVTQSSLNLKDQVNILPNPIGNEFFTVLQNIPASKVSLLLYSMNGQLLSRKEIELLNGFYFGSFNSASLPHGQYVLRVVGDGVKISKRILK
jgi:aminopeptidase N